MTTLQLCPHLVKLVSAIMPTKTIISNAFIDSIVKVGMDGFESTLLKVANRSNFR